MADEDADSDADMDGGGEAVSIDHRSDVDVFGLLANETRVEILRALGEQPDTPLSFSELQDRTDVRDSGNFNYHLDQLLGTFVRKDDDYELTLAGRHIVGAIHAGTYTADARVEPIALDWDCLLCGGEMIAEYADERGKIRCRDCGKGAEFSFPPGTLDQFDREALPAAFGRWLRTLAQRELAGFCIICAGRTTSEIARLPGGTEADPKPSMVSFDCDRCGTTSTISGTSFVTYHPSVEGFFFDHGYDTFEGHPTRVWSQLDRFESEILSEDPPRIRVFFEDDGERISAEITADASIRNVNRQRLEP
ncbi:MAG: hypothetical protein ACI8U4_000263 [Natronomonas sp.]|jgi:hypothetical protein